MATTHTVKFEIEIEYKGSKKDYLDLIRLRGMSKIISSKELSYKSETKVNKKGPNPALQCQNRIRRIITSLIDSLGYKQLESSKFTWNDLNIPSKKFVEDNDKSYILRLTGDKIIDVEVYMFLKDYDYARRPLAFTLEYTDSKATLKMRDPTSRNNFSVHLADPDSLPRMTESIAKTIEHCINRGR